MKTTNNKQSLKSPYNSMWLIISKEYTYVCEALPARKLNFSKKVEKELQKRGFVKINKYWCKNEVDAYNFAADRMFMKSFISMNEKFGKRQRSTLFYISDRQFGLCNDLEYRNIATKKQREKAIII